MFGIAKLAAFAQPLAWSCSCGAAIYEGYALDTCLQRRANQNIHDYAGNEHQHQ